MEVVTLVRNLKKRQARLLGRQRLPASRRFYDHSVGLEARFSNTGKNVHENFLTLRGMYSAMSLNGNREMKYRLR